MYDTTFKYISINRTEMENESRFIFLKVIVKMAVRKIKICIYQRPLYAVPTNVSLLRDHDAIWTSKVYICMYSQTVNDLKSKRNLRLSGN